VDNKWQVSQGRTLPKGVSLALLKIADVNREVSLYDQGYERWDHSALLLCLEKLNSPARLGDKTDIPPET
jgi:hypothetical protein